MHKWVMAVLFYGACVLGLGALFYQVSQHSLTANQPQKEATVTMPTVTLDAAKAEAQYKQTCVACHGGNLEGGMGPNLSKVGGKLTVEKIYTQIQNGGGGMPPFKGQIKDEDIANLAQWLATHK